MLRAAVGGGATPVQREVATLAFDSTRYVGARIGIFDPSGEKVGRVGRLSDRELLVIAGEARAWTWSSRSCVRLIGTG